MDISDVKHVGNNEYICPYCDKVYSEKGIRMHIQFSHTKTGKKFKRKLHERLNKNKVKCRYCNKYFTVANVKRHERACYLNPINIKLCVVCNKPIKDYKKSKGTCSHSCSNIYQKHLRNKDERLNYRTLCFRYHDKKCVVCGEQNIVSVHHLDGNHYNNDIFNLIPLCPTHHMYMHSDFKYLIDNKVNEYIKEFKCNFDNINKKQFNQ